MLCLRLLALLALQLAVYRLTDEFGPAVLACNGIDPFGYVL